VAYPAALALAGTTTSRRDIVIHLILLHSAFLIDVCVLRNKGKISLPTRNLIADARGVNTKKGLCPFIAIGGNKG